jgi:hypothetical protein
MSQQVKCPEDWVWEKIRNGEIADFNVRLGNTLEPKTASGWGDDRRLGTAFLRRLFYDKTYLNDIPADGVRIVGAWFPDGLALPNGQLPRHLSLEQSRFEKPVNLSNQAVDGSLSLEGSFVAAAPEGAPSINLNGTSINGQLSLNGATVEDPLTMIDLKVGHLSMDGSKEKPAKFAAVDLTAAKVNDYLSLDGAAVEGPLKMNGLWVGQHLFMRGSKDNPAKFAAIDLTATKINGYLDFDGATVEGPLTMNNAEVDGLLAFDGATIEGVLAMDGLQAGQHLLMRGSKEKPAKFAVVDCLAQSLDVEALGLERSE